MATSYRGNSVLLNGNLGANVASKWAYVGSATSVTLYIDDNGADSLWTVEVAVGNGEPGLNGISQSNPSAVPSAILAGRDGADYIIDTNGVPVSRDLSPFAAQYIRVRPNEAITGGHASIATVGRNSHSLRGHQVLWNNVDVTNGMFSPLGFVGNAENAVLFLFAQGAFEIQTAPGTGKPGMNETPAPGDWTTIDVAFSGSTATAAIDLSPIGGAFVRLKALGSVSGVTATLAVTD